MKTKNLLTMGLCFATALTFSSCSKENDAALSTDEISAVELNQIKQLGFTTQGAIKTEGGYLVEGDIFLTAENLTNPHAAQLLRVGADEQYRTTEVVSVGAGRTVSVAVSSGLPAAYVTATDEVIRRYNAENLSIRFVRVSSGADITLTEAPRNARYLASAGFPTNGNPFNSVKVNARSIGTANASTYIATILAHEVGHCIGFRHTDYMDRSYSCGGSTSNEGASTVGAILIPGTPSAADPNSWMLACIGGGADRLFNANDRTALGYVY